MNQRSAAEYEAEIEALRARVDGLVVGARPASAETGGAHLVEGAPQMVVRVTDDNKVGFVNAALAKLFGVEDCDACVGEPVGVIGGAAFGDDVLAVLTKATRASGVVQRLELCVSGVDVADGGEAPRLALVATPSASHVEIVIQDVTRLRRLEASFERYVSPAVIQRLHADRPKDLFAMHKRHATVLFADFRDLAEESKKMAPAALQLLINTHLELMSSCVDVFDGTIEGYGYGGLMVIFGAPLPQNDHGLRALVCATEMQRCHREWMTKRQADDLPAPELGIGLDTGLVMTGNVGSPRQLHFTAVGLSTTLSAQLCGASEGGQILITPDSHSSASSRLKTWSGPMPVPRLAFESLGPHRFKDVNYNVQVISVRVKR